MTTMTLNNGQVIDCPKLNVLVNDVDILSDDEYALIRRQGLGASDSSVILGCNPYKQVDQLIIEKRSKEITDEERAIKQKEAVRKGFDLEPLILSKFSKLMDTELPLKPKAMYQINDTPYLTINFDGVLYINPTESIHELIPVECKFVTIYGDKYYNRKHAFKREFGDCLIHRNTRPYLDILDRIKAKAELVGIPPYYYTQVQQQIYGLNSSYGYLAALHDKGWELVVYLVPRDDECITAIKTYGAKVWQQI